MPNGANWGKNEMAKFGLNLLPILAVWLTMFFPAFAGAENSSSIVENAAVTQIPAAFATPVEYSPAVQNAAENCVPNDYPGCYNGSVYWYDSCGNIIELSEDCGGYGCIDADPLNIRCGCAPKAESACYNGSVYWHNSCGEVGELKEDCGEYGCESNQCRCTTSIGCGDGMLYWDNSCSIGNRLLTEEEIRQVCPAAGPDRNCVIANNSQGWECLGENTCFPNNYAECYGGDVYWFDSCGQMGSVSQSCNGLGCTNNVCNSLRCTANSTTQCYDGDIYWFDSCGQQGALKQNCNGNGCANNQCAQPPTIAILGYTPTIQPDEPGVLNWSVSGQPVEIGVNISYAYDKRDAVSVPVKLNPANKYMLAVIPQKSASTIYVQIYAKTASGNEVKSGWVQIKLQTTCGAQNGNCVAPRTLYASTLDPAAIDGATASLLETSQQALQYENQCYLPEIQYRINFDFIDYSELGVVVDAGVTVFKLFTIGSCLDDGWLTLGCGFDAGTTVLMITPLVEASVPVKIAKLASAGKVITAVGTTAKLAKAVRNIKIELLALSGKVALTTTATGTKLAKAADIGIIQIKFITGKIYQKYPALAQAFFKSTQAEAAIGRLRALGSTNAVLETVITKGGDIIRTIRTGSSSKGTVWLEEGTTETGWLKIVQKHLSQFTANGIPGGEVQQKIFDTIKNPTAGIKPSLKGGWCFFSTLADGTFIKAVVGSNGYIVSAFPTKDFVCN